jgi:AcrR family transcriptional regulator
VTARAEGGERARAVDMDDQEARERVLAAAGELFYLRGITAVGMDDIRARSGVPLKRLYRAFPAKERLAEAYLARRDEQWLAALAGEVDRHRDPQQRALAPFAFLAGWFATPDFRGCAFINAFGELGSTSDGVAQLARRHKQRLHSYLTGLAADAGAKDPGDLGTQLLLLMDGAIIAAATGAAERPAASALAAARALLAASVTAAT